MKKENIDIADEGPYNTASPAFLRCIRRYWASAYKAEKALNRLSVVEEDANMLLEPEAFEVFQRIAADIDKGERFAKWLTPLRSRSRLGDLRA